MSEGDSEKDKTTTSTTSSSLSVTKQGSVDSSSSSEHASGTSTEKQTGLNLGEPSSETEALKSFSSNTSSPVIANAPSISLHSQNSRSDSHINYPSTSDNATKTSSNNNFNTSNENTNDVSSKSNNLNVSSTATTSSKSNKSKKTNNKSNNKQLEKEKKDKEKDKERESSSPVNFAMMGSKYPNEEQLRLANEELSHKERLLNENESCMKSANNGEDDEEEEEKNRENYEKQEYQKEENQNESPQKQQQQQQQQQQDNDESISVDNSEDVDYDSVAEQSLSEVCPVESFHTPSSSMQNLNSGPILRAKGIGGMQSSSNNNTGQAEQVYEHDISGITSSNANIGTETILSSGTSIIISPTTATTTTSNISNSSPLTDSSYSTNSTNSSSCMSTTALTTSTTSISSNGSSGVPTTNATIISSSGDNNKEWSRSNSNYDNVSLSSIMTQDSPPSSMGHHHQWSSDSSGYQPSYKTQFSTCSSMSSRTGGEDELSISMESTISKDSGGSNNSTSSKETFTTSQQYITPTSSKETLVTIPYGASIKSKQIPHSKAKKKMWYNVFSTSYKSRSSDFKKLFKKLPFEERLIVDYSCALQKEILLQGRMYVSQNYISFHANIFGWETACSIRLKEVTSITKEKTALVIPNAIQVSTETEKLFFTSFVTRDATYVMLFKLWQSSLLDQTMPSKEIWKLVRASYGDGVASEEEAAADDFLSCGPGGPLHKTPSDSTLMSRTSTDGDDTKSLTDITIDHPAQRATDVIGPAIAAGISLGSSIITSKAVPNGVEHLIIRGKKGDLHQIPSPDGPTDLSDSSDSDGDYLVPDDDSLLLLPIPTCTAPHSEYKETVNGIIPCNVDQLFTMLFDKSKFYWDFHTTRKTFDIVQGEWQQGTDGNKERQVSMTVTLNQAMGPKHSQITEKQIMLPVSKPGMLYAIDAESVNQGIPYEDSFYVASHFCLSRVSANESRLIIMNQVKYKKSVWGLVKCFIEKNSWAGIREFYTHLEQALKEECAKGGISSGLSPTSSPKIVTIGGVVRRRRPKKGPAPAIPLISAPLTSLSAMRNGSIPNATLPRTLGISKDTTHAEGSIVLKLILSVLACLLVLNAYLFFKLGRLENDATTPVLFPHHHLSFTKDLPQNHEDWLQLLQKQEALHRIELQKWHEILISALKILHQAETDLEALKLHITSYGSGTEIASVLKDYVATSSESPVNEDVKQDKTTSHENPEATISDSSNS